MLRSRAHQCPHRAASRKQLPDQRTAKIAGAPGHEYIAFRRIHIHCCLYVKIERTDFTPGAGISFGTAKGGLLARRGGVRALVGKGSASFCVFLSLTFLVGAGGKIPQCYPNELKGFQFYEKYLAPLQPRVSDTEAVRSVLGDTAAVHRNGWKIYTTYEAQSGPVSNPTLGALAEIIVKPDGVIRMGAVKFSQSFD